MSKIGGKSVEKALSDVKFLLLRINNIIITSFQYVGFFCCKLLFFLKSMSKFYGLKNEKLSFEFVFY